MDLYVREALPKHDYEITVAEKVEKLGVEALLDGELLMLCLGIAKTKSKELLQNYSLQQLLSSPLEELQKLLGKKRAKVLLSGLELARRGLQKGLGVHPVISCPADTIPFLDEIKDQQKEHFMCLFLNARNQVIYKDIISIGSLSASIVHPREIFAVGISHSCASIVLGHNHPSSDVSPSRDDLELTKRLVKAGEIMGIEILDHIIIGATDFLSLKERGLM